MVNWIVSSKQDLLEMNRIKNKSHDNCYFNFIQINISLLHFQIQLVECNDSNLLLSQFRLE